MSRRKKKISSSKLPAPTVYIPLGTPKLVTAVTQSSELSLQFSNPKNERKRQPCKIIKFDEFGNEISNSTIGIERKKIYIFKGSKE